MLNILLEITLYVAFIILHFITILSFSINDE